MVSLTLYPDKDTTIRSIKPGKNYGSESLSFYDNPVYVARAFIGFDIVDAPSAADITKVSLGMYVRHSSGRSAVPGFMRRITGAWTESGATWDNSHDIGTGATEISTTFVGRGDENIWDVQDVTALYEEARGAGDRLDIELRTTEEKRKHHLRGNDFDSREQIVRGYGEPYDPQKPYLTIEYEEVPALAFADVAVSRRYGGRLYLSGTIENIIESDEICVYYKRQSDEGIRNLKSDTSEYLYFSGASGSYDLGVNNRYIEFDRSGLYWLKIFDVDGNCETPVLERASWLMDIVLPKFQYQLIFDLEDTDLGDNLWRLEAEYAKYEAVGWWEITHEDPDCFTSIAGHGDGVDETPQSGWLSLGVEFGASPCAPIPYYLCPLPTPQTQYWRGECSCDEFRNTLQPLGIPCSHLIAAMNYYAGDPAWSRYVECP